MSKKFLKSATLLILSLAILTNFAFAINVKKPCDELLRYPQPGGLSRFDDFFSEAEFATQEDIGGHVYTVLIVYPKGVLTEEGAARYSETAFSTLEAKMGRDRRWGDSEYMYSQFYTYCAFTSSLNGTSNAWIIKTKR